MSNALKHLYVLLPVLDDAKHYWVTRDEVGKLLRAGDGWLSEHPERELISRRYLRHHRAYVASALTRLAEADETEEDELDNALTGAGVTAQPDRAQPLAVQRHTRIIALLNEIGAHRVLDLGCGDGALPCQACS